MTRHFEFFEKIIIYLDSKDQQKQMQLRSIEVKKWGEGKELKKEAMKQIDELS